MTSIYIIDADGKKVIVDVTDEVAEADTETRRAAWRNESTMLLEGFIQNVRNIMLTRIPLILGLNMQNVIALLIYKVYFLLYKIYRVWNKTRKAD